MRVDERPSEEDTEASQQVRLDGRDRRALTQYLTVLENVDRAKDVPGLYLVVSQSGKEYLVDAVTGACECADAVYRQPEGGCKHVRRVAFETGKRRVPAAYAGRVPSDFAHFVDAEPKIAVRERNAIVG